MFNFLNFFNNKKSRPVQGEAAAPHRYESEDKPPCFPKLEELIAVHGSLNDAIHQAMSQKTSEQMAQKLTTAENECRLVGWLYSEGKILAQYPEYHRLIEAHGAFHRCAAQVLDCHSNGDLLDAMVLKKGSLQQHSDELLAALHALMEKAQQHCCQDKLPQADAEGKE